jgi:hypothetical protein
MVCPRKVAVEHRSETAGRRPPAAPMAPGQLCELPKAITDQGPQRVRHRCLRVTEARSRQARKTEPETNEAPGGPSSPRARHGPTRAEIRQTATLKMPQKPLKTAPLPERTRPLRSCHKANDGHDRMSAAFSHAPTDAAAIAVRIVALRGAQPSAPLRMSRMLRAASKCTVRACAEGTSS